MPVHGRTLVGALAIALIGLVAAAWWSWPLPSTSVQSQAEEWTCSMHPQIRQPRPGKCPICGMDLVPVTQLSAEQAGLARQAGIETEPVAYRDLFKEVRTVGKLDYNERQVAFITARTAGRVDRVFADFVGVQVHKGDHLVSIYSPDLVVGQSELIRAAEGFAQVRDAGTAKGGFAESALDAARMKLRLLGLLPEQIDEIERTKEVLTHLTIYAPRGGTVIEKAVRAGQYVREGDVLFRIANLDPLWLYLDVYEYDLSWVRFGQTVTVAVEAYPGRPFRGTVTFVDPYLEDRTRTVKARVNLPNPEYLLKPAMYASATIRVRLRSDGTPEPTGLEGKWICPMHPEIVQDKPGKCTVCEMLLEKVPEHRPPASGGQPARHEHAACKPDTPGAESGKVLAIRTTAVLDTGRRKVAYRRNRGGAYELVELQLGPRAEGQDDQARHADYYPVLAGLQAGDRVAVRGGFLLDSQRQIEGLPSLLYPGGQSSVNLHAGHGGAGSPGSSGDSETHKH